MPSDAARPPVPSTSDADENLAGTYTLVVIVEVIVIACLYWLGQFFS